MTETWSTPEKFTEDIILTMTPTLKRRLQDFADARDWHVTDVVRYLIEDGLDSDARRTALSEKTVESAWPPRRAPKKLRWTE
jgi:hypothetical protein